MMAMPPESVSPLDAEVGTDRFERAQQQALEMLFQQCVDEIYAGEGATTLAAAPSSADALAASDREAASSVLDYLAQACEDASDALQEVSPEDVARQLAQAVAATQESLRSVQSSVQGMLADPAAMQALCQQFDEADAHIQQLKLAHAAEQQALLTGDAPPSPTEAPEPFTVKNQQQQLALAGSNEESLRSMMNFADNMCGVLDNALSTISKDEYALAAQLSLGIAQKLLEAGQALFMSIGDDIINERGDRTDRITIEELVEEDQADDTGNGATRAPPAKEKRESIAAKRLRQKREQRKQAAAVRTYVVQLADKAQKGASENPVAAAAIGMFTLPFIGLAIPVASMVGLALVLEKYYPEHTALTMEMLDNFAQMAKLWVLLVKISARQLASVAKQYLVSWHDHATKHGYIATGKELVTTGCSLSWLCISYLYNAIVHRARPSPTT